MVKVAAPEDLLEPEGCPELDHVRELVASAVYAPEHYIDVITIACALTWKLDDFESAPRIIALGEPGSGKSTVLTVGSFLSRSGQPPTGVLLMSAPSYVGEFRIDPYFTPCIDEIHHLFGLAGSNGQHSKFYGYLNQGYLRRTAQVQFQENKVPIHIPIFGVAFLAGLGLAVPGDMRKRGIVLKMEKADDDVEVADFSDPQVLAAFEHGKSCLESLAQLLPPLSVASVRGLHPKLTHRKMEVWGPLFAIAIQAGELWVKRLMTAFERIELNTGLVVHPPEVQVMLDYLEFSVPGGDRAAQKESVASGEFSEWANAQEHRAYTGMKPGQFRQFAVTRLGPTDPYYDPETKASKRGWTGVKHQINLGKARRVYMAVQVRQQPQEAETTGWEDF